MKFAAALLATLLFSSGLSAVELHVVSSGGFAAAYKVLLPEWEASTGNTVITEWGPSMGAAENAVPQRLARGEPIDVLIMAGSALDRLVEQGKVDGTGTAVLARSGICIVAKQGAPHPDVGTVEGLKQALLDARSIAYSEGPSGAYVARELFKKLGIEDEMKSKARAVTGEPVGEVVARGDAALGFQQISDLKPILGVTLLGPLPEAVQLYTDFSAGVLQSSTEKEAATSLVKFLASPAAATVIVNSGMVPAGPPR